MVHAEQCSCHLSSNFLNKQAMKKHIFLSLLALSATIGVQAQQYVSPGRFTVGLHVGSQGVGALGVAPFSSAAAVTADGIGYLVVPSEQTGVATVQTAQSGIDVEDGCIVVRHKAAEARVHIYAPDGRCVYAGSSAKVRVTPGLYLVRSGAQCAKVVVE